MGIEVHTVEVLDGSQLSDGGKLRVGFFKGIQLATPSGPIADAVLTAGGDNYTSLPTPAVAGGTSATLAILMAISQSAVGAGGAGYASGDTITMTGGTSTEEPILEIDTVSASGAVLTYHFLNDGGLFSVLPTGALTQGATSGAGTGFTLSATAYRVASLTASGGTGYQDNAPVTFTGGGGTGAAGYVSTAPSGDPVQALVRIPGLSPNAVVLIQPNAPAVVEYTIGVHGVNVELSEASGGVLPTAFDMVVFA